MTERLCGIETEYAASATDSRGRRVSQDDMLGALLDRVRAELPFLPDAHSDGGFLKNAARIYVDVGGHPEVTTPECTNPWDVVRYVRAGESVLLGLTNGSISSETTSFYRTNVDYSGTGATWGCHESYMHRADPVALPTQLIPHLVSRIVYTGAGGFDNTSAGAVFTLSPRAAHVSAAVSNDSTGNRGIFHTKDESLCGGDWHRLHVIFGESLCSELATWLKIGTTSLILALCEAQVRPGSAVALSDAVAAARTFAGDPTCTVQAETNAGWRSAVSIQRHYLAQVEAHVGAVFMPPWAEAVCDRWRQVLDRLENGWESVATQLDWAIKLALYRDRVRRGGLEWESLGAWTRVVEAASRALAAKRLDHRRLRAGFLLRPSSPIREQIERLTPIVETMGLDWSGLDAFLETRAELFEIDTRFGQLGDRGVFTALDSAGVLDHGVEGVDDIPGAVDSPPDVARARLRGQLVTELSGNDDRYRCGWEGIWDFEAGRSIDLSDPFGAVLEWKDWSPGSRRRLPGFLARMRARLVEFDPVSLNQDALARRQLDDLEEAERLLRRAIEIEDARLPADSPKRPHRRNNLALVLLRAGELEEAARVNAEAWCLKAGQHDVTSGRILFVRIALRFLEGDSDVGFYLGQLKTLLGAARLACLGNIQEDWTIPDVFEMLYEDLDFPQAELLRRIARGLEDHPDVSELEEQAVWNAAAAVPLEVAWPEE